MNDVEDGFIPLTDPRLARQETIWILTLDNKTPMFSQQQLYTAVQGERTVYEMSWEGGGKITTRIM